MTTDERLGLPSASAMQRIFGCPASLALTNRLRAQGLLPRDHGNEYATHGEKGHGILEKLARGEDVSGEDKDLLDEARDMWEEANTRIMAVFGEPIENLEVMIEERLWINIDGKPVMSGRFDLIAIKGKKALIIDYKTGHKKVADASENFQLAAGAVLLREVHGMEEIHGCIIEAHRKPTTTVFNLDSVARFRAIMIEHFDKSATEHPLSFGFNPSEENCTYCPNRLHCPRLLDDVRAVVRIASGGPESVGLIAAASTPVLSDFLCKCETVEKIQKAAKAEMEARLNAGEHDDNWHVAASAPRRVVTNAKALAQTLIAQGCKTDEVIASMSMTVGNAEALLGAVCAWKGAKLKAHLAELAGDSIGMSEPKPSLKRKS